MRFTGLRTVILRTVDVSENVLAPNEARARTLLQNLGPGNVWASPNQQDSRRGVQLRPFGVLIENPPGVHVGDWYVITDAPETQLVVGEWARTR